MHALLPDLWRRGKVPVVVGGTGLYVRALIRGLAPVPEVPAGERERAAAEAYLPLAERLREPEFHGERNNFV